MKATRVSWVVSFSMLSAVACGRMLPLDSSPPPDETNDSNATPTPVVVPTDLSVQQVNSGVSLSWAFDDAQGNPTRTCKQVLVDTVSVTALLGSGVSKTLFAAGTRWPCASDAQGDTTIAVLASVPVGDYTFTARASSPGLVFSTQVLLHVVTSTTAPKVATIPMAVSYSSTGSNDPAPPDPVVVGTIAPVGCDASDPFCYACDPSDPSCCDPTTDPSCPAPVPTCDPSTDPSCGPPVSCDPSTDPSCDPGTCDPSDPSCTGTCDPSDPTCSGNLRTRPRPARS